MSSFYGDKQVQKPRAEIGLPQGQFCWGRVQTLGQPSTYPPGKRRTTSEEFQASVSLSPTSQAQHMYCVFPLTPGRVPPFYSLPPTPQQLLRGLMLSHQH